MSSKVGSLLRRFVAICQSEADPTTRLSHPLNRSALEWSHLSDLLTSLLQTCPPARSAILSFLHPIVVAHLQAISTHQQPPMIEGISPQKRRWQPPLVLPSEAFIIAILAEAMEVCKRETGLLRDQSQPSFIADVCLFALDILTPISPPPHREVSFVSRYRRNRMPFRQHASTHPRRHHKNGSNTNKRPHSDVESTVEDASELDETNDSISEVESSGTDSDCVMNEVISSDDVEMKLPASVLIVETEDNLPDLRPIGFNLHLLGPLWMSSAVVKQLLRIVFACLLGRLACCACIERLVAVALPHDFRGCWRRASAPPPHPMNHKMDLFACQPHWCINWLLRQLTDAGMSSAIEPFCLRLLDVCLRGPPLGQLTYNVGYHQYWVLAGLSNLAFCCVFFTSLVRQSLINWLEKNLAELRAVQPPLLIHVLAPLMVLSPRSSSVFPDSSLAQSTLSRLRQPSVHPPPSNISRWGPSSHPPPSQSQAFNTAPSALVVASGFLSHEFHLLPVHSEQVCCLVEACTEIRSAFLSTIKTYVEKMVKQMNMKALESTIESLFIVVPSQDGELFKELLVDSICLASEECGCGCIELLLRLELSSSPSSATASCIQTVLRLLCLRAHEAVVSRSLPDSEVPPFFLGQVLLNYNGGNGASDVFVPSVISGDGGGVFMRHFIERGSYCSGLLLLLHSCYTRSSHLTQNLFKSIMLWNVGERQHDPDRARCPLLFFYPLLSEWNSLNRGCSSASEELLQHCLRDVLDVIAIASWEDQQKALLNLLWLVRREQLGIEKTELQLGIAVRNLLPLFVALIPGLVEESELKSLEVVLNILESVDHLPPIHLSVADSICVGRRLTYLLVSLMDRMDEANLDLQDIINRAFHQLECLLVKISETEELVRSSALVSIAKAACDKFSTTKASPLFLPNPASILPGTDRSSTLLLSNPPSPPPELAPKSTAIKGQLIRRNPPNCKAREREDVLAWKPFTCLWIQLAQRLISSSTSGSSVNVIYQHYFGGALEDALLPHGLQLPETNVQTCSLNPPTFQQPWGLGLERILVLLRAFLPDWKLSSPSCNERILWGFLELLLQPHSSILSNAAKNSTDDTTKRLPLPATRLLLGLLSGLEVTWTSVLAPRVPLCNFTDDDTVQVTLGVFPLPGLPTVARQRARKLAVDHGHRRVDTSSRLYNATELLLTRLAQFPVIQKISHQLSSTHPNPLLPPPPIEGLLRLLTPREIAFCLSETRRGVRLRSYLSWRGGGGVGESGNGVFALSAAMLRALTQSHLMEEGLASLFPRLLQFTPLSSSASSSSSFGNLASSRRLLSIFNRKSSEEGDEEQEQEENESGEMEEGEEDEGGRIREIDVDGEVMVVLDD